MNITNKQYAKGLYETVLQAEDGEVEIALKNFVKVLAQRNNLGRSDKIIKEFEKIWNQEQGIMEGELVSARELDKEIIELLNSHITKLLNAESVKMKQAIDKSILGGFTARLGGIVIDGSVKTQLQILKNKLSHY